MFMELEGSNRGKSENLVRREYKRGVTETHYCASQADTFAVFPSIVAR